MGGTERECEDLIHPRHCTELMFSTIERIGRESLADTVVCVWYGRQSVLGQLQGPIMVSSPFKAVLHQP